MQSFHGERTWQHTKHFFFTPAIQTVSYPDFKKKKKRSYFQSSRNIWIVCPLLFMFLAVKFSESSNFQLHLVDNNSFPSQKTTRLKISSLSPAISQKEWVVFPCWSVILWTSAMKSKDNKWTSSCRGDMRLYVPNKKLVGWLWTIGENLTTVSPSSLVILWLSPLQAVSFSPWMQTEINNYPSLSIS